MIERMIFISCGQQSQSEKRLGTSAFDLINSKPGYRAYFAEYVQCLDGLTKNILDSLRTCSGFISFLHERGQVIQNDKIMGFRSSVWINQEIAILAY